MATTVWALFGQTSITLAVRIFMLPMIRPQSIFTRMKAMESSRRSGSNRAPLSAMTAPNRLPWGSHWETTTTPGRPSIYVTNFSDENDLLYRNEGDWNFKEVSYAAGVALPSLPYVKWGTAFVDLDNDGWLDLITVDGHVYPQVDTLPSGAGYREPKLLQLNQKDGTFCDASTRPATR